MRVTVITAFPEFLESFLSTSIIGRAAKKGLIDVEVMNLRDYAEGGYRQVDDYTFGGGGGMVLMAEPLTKALKAASDGDDSFVVYPSPQGAVLTQEMVQSLAQKKHVVIICGHYEGVDERFVDKSVDLEVSIGDYVLTGGELPAMVLIDAVSRLVPGVVGKGKAVVEDSFYRGMLDNPHYTRPAEWEGLKVPEVLLSGHDRNVANWRRQQAVSRTLRRRPDLLSRANIQPYLEKGAYAVMVHSPVRDKEGARSTAAITGLDLHDVSRACRTYGLKRFLVTTPLSSQRGLAKQIVSHWIEGYGAKSNPDRGEALKLLKLFPSLDRAVSWVRQKEHVEPLVIATSAVKQEGSLHWLELKRMVLEAHRPVLFVFGTGQGLHEDVIKKCTAVMQPITGGAGDYNHLSVRSAVSITLDRFFGWR